MFINILVLGWFPLPTLFTNPNFLPRKHTTRLIRKRARKRVARVEGTAGVVEKQLVEEAKQRGEAVSSANVLTQKQLKNMRSYIRASGLPSRDERHNIHALYHECFLQQSQDFLTIRLILATPKQLSLLAEHGRVVLIDTTFNISSQKLHLTTLLVFVRGWPVPAAWFLSNKQTAKEYRYLSFHAQSISFLN